MLKCLIDNFYTDKNTRHSYLDTYEKLFLNKKDKVKNVLEIGICKGGSIKLWNDYFSNADIYGIDIIPEVPEFLKDKKRIHLFNNTDAYNDDFVKNNLSDKKYDIIIDDGPHTSESGPYVIKKYLPLLSDDGILIIEDCPCDTWIERFKRTVPEKDKKNIQVVDLRHKNNIEDDMLFIINRSSP